MVIMASLNALLDGLANYFGWILSTVTSVLAFGAIRNNRKTNKNERDIQQLKKETKLDEDPTRFESHEERMERQQSDISDLKAYFTGDDDDPGNPGLLSEVHDIKQHLDDDE